MYEWMCRLYGVPRDHKVWLGGKAPIFAFLEHQQFDAFEERFYPEARESLRTLANVYGLSHLDAGGEVVISCYRGNDPNDFAQMLVHETSHGFIHRYKTKARLPNWVDEGMADLIGAEMAPASTAVKNREYKALQQLAQQRSLGGMFAAERIEAGHYGMASNLNRFLLQSNRENYVRFIEALKEGQKWEEALHNAYGSTPDELLAAYALDQRGRPAAIISSQHAEHRAGDDAGPCLDYTRPSLRRGGPYEVVTVPALRSARGVYLACHVCRSSRIGAGGLNCQAHDWSTSCSRNICHAARGRRHNCRAMAFQTRGLNVNDRLNCRSQYSLVRW